MHRIFLRGSTILAPSRLSSVEISMERAESHRMRYPVRVQRTILPSELTVYCTRTVVEMRQPRSIRFHFALVFLFFFLLVVLLGWFSISRLDSFNKVSADVAEVWLPDTRLLGDL